MYTATICQLTNVRKHPNADKLKIANVFGNQVIVGIHDQEGDIGIFFPTDGQLSNEFAQANDLIRRKNLTTGLTEGGMFDENRRVRAIRLRGEKSDGFWCPIVLLKFTGVNLYDLSKQIGYQFTSINGVPICNKYETPATKQARVANKPHREVSMFAKHFETEQFRNDYKNIPAHALITLTEKLHGTSHRVGRVLVTNNSFKARILKLFGAIPLKWDYVHGTRNVVLDESFNDYFHKSDFRQIVAQKLNGNLYKGEVIYLEIVGYSDTNTPIMPPHDVKKLKMPDVLKAFGTKMNYTYGCAPGTCEIYVYRITRVNEDNIVTELSWPQVMARCHELDVQVVPQLATFLNEFEAPEIFFNMVEEYSEGLSTLNPQQIREGVCVRVDSPEGTKIYKQKNFMFREMEANQKDDDTVVDIEEST